MATSAKAVLGTIGGLSKLVSGVKSAVSSASQSSGAPSWLGMNPDGSRDTSRTSSSSAASSITAAIDNIYKITDRNTARSEQQAAELRDWQERQNRIAMDFNAAEAAKNRDWQEMMSNTAHQREIKDLQAAGLNPVLSAMGGNGAAVTSGATASGVTSSGAKGEVDTSLTQGLVSLLGTLWSAQTTLEAQRLNAQNNMAIAEKNNATSELVAQMYTQQAREASELAAMTGLSQSQISAAATRAMAAYNYAATKYGADSAYAREELSTSIQKEISSMNIEANKRNLVFTKMNDLIQTSMSVKGQLDAAGIHAQSAKDVAGIQSETAKRGQNFQLAGDLIRSITGLGSDYLKSSYYR